MDFREYQEKARQTAVYPNIGNNIYYAALGLGEVGELQNKVKKVMRDYDGVVTEEMKKDLEKELGDILWYVATFCSELKVDMNDVAEKNIDKLFDRKARGVIKGSGDDR